MQKEIGDPGADGALKLALQSRGVRNQVGGARGAAGGFEQPDRFARENIRRSGSYAGDPFFVSVVIAQGHALLVFADGANRGKVMATAEIRVRIRAKHAAQDSMLIFCNVAGGVAEAGEFGETS